MSGFIMTSNRAFHRSCPQKLSQTNLARRGFQKGTALTWGNPTVGNSRDTEEGISLVVFALHLEIKALLWHMEGWPSPQLVCGLVGEKLCGQSEEGLP